MIDGFMNVHAVTPFIFRGICGLKCGRNTVYMGSLLPGVYNIGDNGDDGRIYKRMQSSLSHLEEFVG